MTDLYWNNFYAENTIQIEPSDFSNFCYNFIKKYFNVINELKLLDLGCGNGRDSLYFANNGINVLGIDKCETIINKNKNLLLNNNLTTLDFVIDDFIITKYEADIYYSRFSVHSINENDLDIFLKNIYDKMKNGNIFFIETRSITGFSHDNKLETNYKGCIGKEHYRILYSLNYLKQKLVDFGFKILNYNEDKGLAKFKDEDPYVIRLTCTKYDQDYINDIKTLLYNIITPYHLSSQKHKIHIFKQMVNHLEKFGISYWLCYGTLLGYLRYGTIIPWDDDIDICINIKDLKQLQNSVYNTNYVITKTNNMLYRFTIGNIDIDIFVIDFSLDNPKEMKFDEVYPLSKGIFCNIECNIPNKYKDFFNRRYGHYDHINTCLIWNHKINNYWNKDFVNNKFLIVKDDCDKIIFEIQSLIDNNTNKSIQFINNFQANKDIDLVLSCVFYNTIDMFLNQLSNILTFNNYVIIIYKIKKSLFDEIESLDVNIPPNVLFNDNFINEDLFDISIQNNKLLLCHIDNFQYVNNKITFNYFGFISQNSFFLKPIDIMTSYNYFKIDIEKNEWKNQYIRNDKIINCFEDIYGGQLDGTIIPKYIIQTVFKDIKFEEPLQDYPYHEVYIPTFTYNHIKNKPFKSAFCKICWTNKYYTIKFNEILASYNTELFSAIYISDHIPYNDSRRTFNNINIDHKLMIIFNINKNNVDTKLMLRNIDKNDYKKKYLNLLGQLTSINPDNISFDDFENLINKLDDNHYIIVIEDLNNNIIIGSATLFIEYKFIHNMGKVGHIEDVVIHQEFRNYGLGKLIIDMLIMLAKKSGCYKIILNCARDNVNFYQKCGFVEKEIEMVKYFNI